MIHSEFNSCAFCPTDGKNLYKCPRCQAFYCSVRCYRTKKHLECSENFYQRQCEQSEGIEHEIKDKTETKRPVTTFEEFMKISSQKDQKPTDTFDKNPQIEVNSNEEILFDSDDEPDYLVDVVQSSIDQFESLNMDELDRRLLSAGISPHIGANPASEEENQDVMESLFSQLNPDERKAFARLANEMLNAEQTNQTCFKPRKTSKK